jgi:hypothetical protein
MKDQFKETVKYKPGYYIDQTNDLAIVYPCGKIEVLTAWDTYELGSEEGYYFDPREFLGPL